MSGSMCTALVDLHRGDMLLWHSPATAGRVGVVGNDFRPGGGGACTATGTGHRTEGKGGGKEVVVRRARAMLQETDVSSRQ